MKQEPDHSLLQQLSPYDQYTLEELRSLQVQNSQVGIVDRSLNEAIRTYSERQNDGA